MSGSAKNDVIQYRVGQEAHPTSMLLALAEMHGIREEVSTLVSNAPQEPPEYPDGLGGLLKKHRSRTNTALTAVHARCQISKSQLGFYESGMAKNPGLRSIQGISYGYRIPFIEVLMATLAGIHPRMPMRKRRRD